MFVPNERHTSIIIIIMIVSFDPNDLNDLHIILQRRVSIWSAESSFAPAKGVKLTKVGLSRAPEILPYVNTVVFSFSKRVKEAVRERSEA